MAINVIHGDATNISETGKHILVHGCNARGAWGSGFVLAVDKLSNIPRIAYKRWHMKSDTYCPWRRERIPLELGQVQVVPVRSNNLAVANLISQLRCGYTSVAGIQYPSANYQAIELGLLRLKEMIHNHDRDIQIHMPMIGAGLGGLSFYPIYNFICHNFPNVTVNIYGFNQKDYRELCSMQCAKNYDV